MYDMFITQKWKRTKPVCFVCEIILPFCSISLNYGHRHNILENYFTFTFPFVKSPGTQTIWAVFTPSFLLKTTSYTENWKLQPLVPNLSCVNNADRVCTSGTKVVTKLTHVAFHHKSRQCSLRVNLKHIVFLKSTS